MKKKCVQIEKSILLILGVLIGVSFVIAGVSVWITDSSSFFSFNETDSQIYNISINASGNGLTQNVTQINITLPTGFIFEAGSNITNATNASRGFFSNTTTILLWNSTTEFALINSTILVKNKTYFAFNATASIPGKYNFIVKTLFGNGSVFTSNISVRINDTTAPTVVAFVSPGTTNLKNVSFGIPINISVTDEGTDIGRFNKNITIFVYNSSVNVVNVSSSITNVTSFFLNFTGLSDGVYMINATANDTQGNTNSSVTINITLDSTDPVITFSCDPTSTNVGQTITCTCTATDATSGVNTTIFTLSPSTATTGTFSTSCTVTDNAGNSVVVSRNYDVFTSSAAPSGTGGNGGTTYTKTYVVTDEQFAAGYTKEVKTNEKIRFKVKGKTHNVGVTSLTASSITISVFSIHQEATLQVGDTRKFDVLDDGFFDISVKLESIENNRAKLTLNSIHEEITAEAIAAEEVSEEEAVAIKEEEELKEGKNLTTMWIIIGIIVVLILIGVGYKVKKN